MNKRKTRRNRKKIYKRIKKTTEEERESESEFKIKKYGHIKIYFFTHESMMIIINKRTSLI